MDKLTMAHEVACAMIGNGCSMHTAMADAWRYADAMQAEADKRKADVVVMPASVDDFQIDWSQAPKWATGWYMTNSGVFHWCERRPYQDASDWLHSYVGNYMTSIAPSFNYTGAWQDSLRKRPQ